MNYIPFNYYTISLVLGGFIALISGISVLLQDYKKSENQAWFALTMSTAVWSFSYFFMTVSPTHKLGLINNWILHYAAIYIPLFYYVMILIITKKVKQNKILILFFTSIAIFFTAINQSSSFVEDVIPKVGFNYAPKPGYLYIYFFIYFVMLVMTGLVTSAIEAAKTNNQQYKARLTYTIIFTIAASVGGGSVFLTTFLTVIPPYFLILFSIYPVISVYAIFRHKLFDAKLLATQIFIFTLWTFIFFRALLSTSLREQIINFTLLIATMILGTLVIRSVKREVQTRERIEHLAKDLEQTNKQLESANDRLKELDQLKSEFVSLATHQIRAPLTAIKGYISLIQEGDYGPVSNEVESALDIVMQSTNNLVTIVGDFLDVSRIEQGRMKYDFKDFDIQQLINQVVAELKPNIEKKGLSINYTFEQSKDYKIFADLGKIKQVIGNIIDNSVKYTPKGHIGVALLKPTANKIMVRVSDTGVGINPKVMLKLFQKFTRADNANEVNILGTGLGLYVARQMVEAHQGKIWAESEGEGKGSQFYIELPVKSTLP